MDEVLALQVTHDATMIQSILAAADPTNSYLDLAKDAAARILKACAHRPGKRAREPSPEPGKRAREPSPEPSPEPELDDKDSEMRASGEAGGFVLPFGKHAGQKIRDVPPPYLCWLMGVKRQRRGFVPVPVDSSNYVRSKQAATLAKVQAYLTWRCWTCGSQDVSFRRAQLCRACWHEFH